MTGDRQAKSLTGGNSNSKCFRSEIVKLQSKHDIQLADLRKHSGLKDEEIAALKAEIRFFKTEAKKLKER